MDSRLSRASQTSVSEFRRCASRARGTRFPVSSATKAMQSRQNISLLTFSSKECQAMEKKSLPAFSASQAIKTVEFSASRTGNTSQAPDNSRVSTSHTTVARSSNSHKHDILNPGFWRQLLSKQVMVSNCTEELQHTSEEVESEKEVLIEAISSAAYDHIEDLGFSGFHKMIAAPVEHLKESWNQVSEISEEQGEMTRRRVLGTPMYMSLAWMFGGSMSDGNAHALVKAVIDASKAPSKPFDPADKRLQDAATTFQNALNASTVVEEERLWTQVIEKYESLEAEWVADIIARAYGNRGNARSRQGRLDQALEDYDKSISLAPYAVDPVLNRGVVLESLGRYDEASADYVAVLRAQPKDPAAWNNLGNVKAAQNRWEDALVGYAKAMELAPVFSFAAANYALALYQVGRVNEAVKQFRSLLRKYPEFPDMRAALAVSLYAEGLTAEAESNWERLEDRRYRDRTWVRNTRRWPPRLVNELEAFLDVSSSKDSAV